MSGGYFYLKDYVRSLLLEGKREDHNDFRILFDLFGTEKIIDIIIKVKEELKHEEESAKKKEEERRKNRWSLK